jgi:hypothetical protein
MSEYFTPDLRASDEKLVINCFIYFLFGGPAFANGNSIPLPKLENYMNACIDRMIAVKSKPIAGGVVGRCVLAGLALALSASSSATTFTFNFDSLGDGANNTSVQTYMRTIISGTNVAGSGASRTYNGDGFVIGPTLGGPGDTFIRNVGSDHFTFDFGSSFHIYSLSFDWEIFPDGSCYRSGSGDHSSHAACANAGASDPNWPDFDLYVNHSSTAVFSRVALATGSLTNYPQAIGVSGTINLPGAGGNYLDFVDWPATIAIDNLVINGCRDTETVRCVPPLRVPEPSSLPLAALGLALVGFCGWRARRDSRLASNAVQ